MLFLKTQANSWFGVHPGNAQVGREVRRLKVICSATIIYNLDFAVKFLEETIPSWQNAGKQVLWGLSIHHVPRQIRHDGRYNLEKSVRLRNLPNSQMSVQAFGLLRNLPNSKCWVRKFYPCMKRWCFSPVGQRWSASSAPAKCLSNLSDTEFVVSWSIKQDEKRWVSAKYCQVWLVYRICTDNHWYTIYIYMFILYICVYINTLHTRQNLHRLE